MEESNHNEEQESFLINEVEFSQVDEALPAPKATATKNKKLKTRQWSHDETMKLIDLWGSEDCLYNAQSENYRDKNKRMNAINRIVNELAELEIIVNNDDVSAKLYSLRVYTL